jgi:hypothetical protein
MLQQLLLSACEQADHSETAVRAAALMHIARVLARSDQAAAEQLLEQGIALAKQIDVSGRRSGAARGAQRPVQCFPHSPVPPILPPQDCGASEYPADRTICSTSARA